jgi:hypothetical protein
VFFASKTVHLIFEGNEQLYLQDRRYLSILFRVPEILAALPVVKNIQVAVEAVLPEVNAEALVAVYLSGVQAMDAWTEMKMK